MAAVNVRRLYAFRRKPLWTPNVFEYPTVVFARKRKRYFSIGKNEQTTRFRIGQGGTAFVGHGYKRSKQSTTNFIHAVPTATVCIKITIFLHLLAPLYISALLANAFSTYTTNLYFIYRAYRKTFSFSKSTLSTKLPMISL